MKKGASSIRCFECGKKGHIKPEYPTLKGKTKKSFSTGQDEDNEDLSSSQQGDESESGHETANLTFMTIDDSSHEVHTSNLFLSSSYTFDCDGDDENDDDPINLLKELNSQCTLYHTQMVEAQKKCVESDKEISFLRAQVDALKHS